MVGLNIPEEYLIVARRFIAGYKRHQHGSSPGGTAELKQPRRQIQSSLRDSWLFVHLLETGNKLPAYYLCVPPGRVGFRR